MWVCAACHDYLRPLLLPPLELPPLGPDFPPLPSPASRWALLAAARFAALAAARSRVSRSLAAVLDAVVTVRAGAGAGAAATGEMPTRLAMPESGPPENVAPLAPAPPPSNMSRMPVKPPAAGADADEPPPNAKGSRSDARPDPPTGAGAAAGMVGIDGMKVGTDDPKLRGAAPVCGLMNIPVIALYWPGARRCNSASD